MDLRALNPRTLFRTVAIAEACSWAGLLVGMFFKHVKVTEVGVQVFGPIHGVIFVAYLVSVLVVRRPLRWGPDGAGGCHRLHPAVRHAGVRGVGRPPRTAHPRDHRTARARVHPRLTGRAGGRCPSGRRRLSRRTRGACVIARRA